MRTALMSCALLGAPFLAADTLRFAPDAQARVTKTLTQTADLTSTVAEVEIENESDSPVIEISLDWERTLGFTDTYLASADGRPTKLRRDFDELEHEANYSMSVDAEGFQYEEENTVTGESGLEGTAVVFTRAGDDVSVAWVEDEEGDDGLLTGLSLEADLIGFLPEGAVEQGDRWDVDGAALVALLVPGGDPGFELSFSDDERAMEVRAVGLEPAFLSLFEHTLGDPEEVDASATYKGTREHDGRRVGVIALALGFESDEDVADAMEPWMDPIRGEEGPSVELVMADALVRLEAKGELLWDLQAGRVHALELTGDLTVGLARQVTIDAGGELIGVTLDLELEGSLEVTLETE